MQLLANKKASHEYSWDETIEAGIVLTGGEVKSLRKQSGSLTGSFVKIIGEEAFLIHAQISPYAFADNREYDPKRTRKLLLKKKEVFKLLEVSSQQGRTLVPVAITLRGRHIKVQIAVAKGRKIHEKKQVLKERDLRRAAAQELKYR